MPRNSAGAFQLASGNPVVSNTTVASTWANSTLADIATELTSSLDRSGRGAMIAPLQLTSGTSGSPSLAFASEISSGLYRAGAGDIRLQVNGTDAVLLADDGITIPVGLTVTQNTANAVGATITGNGTAAGLTVLGGSSSGTGIVSTGGGSSAHGLVSTGTGSSVGVVGNGGPTAGAGGFFTGGATNGVGVHAAGSGTADGLQSYASGNGTSGVLGTGGVGGAGVYGQGGSSEGIGVYGNGGLTNGTGMVGQGTGNGAGGKFFNAVNGTSAACEGHANSTTGAGVLADNSGSGPALQVGTGNAKFTASNPAVGTGFSNTVTPKNICKAWAVVQVTAGPTMSLVEGFNISGINSATNDIQLTFATAMTDAHYAVNVSDLAFTTAIATLLGVTERNAGSLKVGSQIFNSGSTWSVNTLPTAVGTVFSVAVYGAQ